MAKFRRRYALFGDLLETLEDAYILDPYMRAEIVKVKDTYYEKEEWFSELIIEGNFTKKELFDDLED